MTEQGTHQPNRGDARPQQVDVVIVGAGMVGLPLAVALAGAGLDVAVIDRADPVTWGKAEFDGRVSAIARGSTQALDALGLWAGMSRHAAPILDIRVTDSDAPVFLHFASAEAGDRPLGYIVENRITRQHLAEKIAGRRGVRLAAPAEIAAIARQDDAAEVTLTTGEVIRAALVVGADGRGSLVREAAEIPVTEWRYDQGAVVTTVTHERDHEGVAEERFLPAGPFAILPMTDDAAGRHRSSLVWTDRADRIDALLAISPADFASELGARFGTHLGAVVATGPRWSHPLGLMLAESYIAPRMALVGDAAHGIHPIAGQGLNLGIRDVAALAEVVVDAHRLGLDIGATTVLAEYQRWRRFDNVSLAAATDALNRLFSTDFAPLAVARRLGLAVVGRIGPARRFFMNEALGLSGDLPRLMRGEPI